MTMMIDSLSKLDNLEFICGLLINKFLVKQGVTFTQNYPKYSYMEQSLM